MKVRLFTILSSRVELWSQVLEFLHTVSSSRSRPQHSNIQMIPRLKIIQDCRWTERSGDKRWEWTEFIKKQSENRITTTETLTSAPKETINRTIKSSNQEGFTVWKENRSDLDAEEQAKKPDRMERRKERPAEPWRRSCSSPWRPRRRSWRRSPTAIAASSRSSPTPLQRSGKNEPNERGEREQLGN